MKRRRMSSSRESSSAISCRIGPPDRWGPGKLKDALGGEPSDRWGWMERKVPMGGNPRAIGTH